MKKEIQEMFNITFSNRHLDNLLIENANFKNSEKSFFELKIKRIFL